MSTRPKRRLQIKSESPSQLPRKWNTKEMETLLECIKKFGHKNLPKISEHLPGRTTEKIKTFMRTVHDKTGQLETPENVADGWLNLCNIYGGTPWRDCIQIAQVLKYLSVDGLLENHPLPERCQGIDFRQAYQLVYQAMMGYPIKPVNKPTADFVLETLAELTGEINKQTDVIKRVESFLKEKIAQEEQRKAPAIKTDPGEKKTLKVYQRKRPASIKPTVQPVARIIVEEVPGGSSSNLGSTKDFSVIVEGDRVNLLTTVNVPVPYEGTVNKDEMELLNSLSYNPFCIPKKWLKEPLYVSLLQTL